MMDICGPQRHISSPLGTLPAARCWSLRRYRTASWRLQRQMEYLHHGDALVPRQQRFGQYTRSLMKALDVPVHNTYGLRPALVKGTKEIAPLTAFRDIDKLGLLKNVPTLNFHPHLPHYEITEKDLSLIHI